MISRFSIPDWLLPAVCGIAAGIFCLTALRNIWLTEMVDISFAHSNTTRFTMTCTPLDSKGYPMLKGGVSLEIPETGSGSEAECSFSIPAEKAEHLLIRIDDCSGKFTLRDFTLSGDGRRVSSDFIISCGSTLSLQENNGRWEFYVSGSEGSELTLTLPRKVKGSASIYWFPALNIIILSAAAGWLAAKRFADKNKDRPSLANCIELLFAAVCFIIIALPPTGIDTDTVARGENRKLAPPPEIIKNRALNSGFFREFDLWYSDRFMGRSNGIDLYQQLFRPTGKAFPGENGWYFSNIYGASDAACNKILYTESELEEIRARLETLEKYLASCGCRFYLVLVPSKGRVYRDFYPASYPLLNPVSKYEQLAEYLAVNTTVPVIDPLPEMLRQRELPETGDLYHRFGTHWTPEGAYTAYKLLREAVTKDFPASGTAMLPAELDMSRDFPAETELLMQLDIDPAEHISAAEAFYPSWRQKKAPISSEVTSELRIYNFISRRNISAVPADCGAEKPKVYFYGDSFLDALLLCESAHFSEAEIATVAHAGDYHLRLGAREFHQMRPHIYVLLTNELGLDRLLRLDLPEEN